MRRIIYSVCIGSLALALTAWGAQVNDRRPDRAKAQRTSNVRAARPANTHATMGARHNTSTTANRQRSYAAPRTSSQAAVNQNTRMNVVRERNFARNQALRERNMARNQEFRARHNVAVNRDRNVVTNRMRNAEVRARNNAAVNRERNLAANRARNVEVNRNRNTEQFRARNNLAVNRNGNFAGNRTRNFAYYRGGNVRINNNFRSEAFRGQQYATFRNYHRQWHDRGWWRSHYDRIVFVNNGWYYWNAGYWFPAWGYATDAYYPYDGPIYGYNGLTPDRVIVDVQEQLQRDGYYHGPIDGVLGPMTREAIAVFQADSGLAVTSVIDEPTLITLGIA
jgi:hypothetical protein